MGLRRRTSISGLFVLCQIVCTASAQQCRNEYSIYGMKLNRHTFKKSKASNWRACIQACEGDIRCQSINYVISQGMCELNNRTKEARPGDFVPDEKRSYMKRFNERVSLGSISELPAESCAEIRASEGDNIKVSGNYWFHSIKPGETILAPCSWQVEECINYQSLTNGDRKITNDASPLRCDETLGPAWFRFQGEAGTKMPTSCVPSERCGTHATGWLNSTHPTVEDGKVTRQVCFSWGVNCCQWSINIQVRNCGGYFIYYIAGTPPQHPCNLGFCSSD